jgi:hypothetical protein
MGQASASVWSDQMTSSSWPESRSKEQAGMDANNLMGKLDSLSFVAIQITDGQSVGKIANLST